MAKVGMININLLGITVDSNLLRFSTRFPPNFTNWVDSSRRLTQLAYPKSTWCHEIIFVSLWPIGGAESHSEPIMLQVMHDWLPGRYFGTKRANFCYICAFQPHWGGWMALIAQYDSSHAWLACRKGVSEQNEPTLAYYASSHAWLACWEVFRSKWANFDHTGASCAHWGSWIALWAHFNSRHAWLACWEVFLSKMSQMGHISSSSSQSHGGELNDTPSPLLACWEVFRSKMS